jgi:mannose-6-phosphate isomerase
MQVDPRRLLLLKNPVQTYAWGSLNAIPDLLGHTPEPGKPHAELWIGAHPKAPSVVLLPAADGGPSQPAGTLLEWIQAAPRAMLGEQVVARFGPRLPFLLKVLAAEQPLSIQAHPNPQQARAGFARENAASIPLAAAERNYRDANHKPECICALTPFWALHGLRPAAEVAELLRVLGLERVAAGRDLLEALAGSSEAAAGGGEDARLREFWRRWLQLRPEGEGSDPRRKQRRALIEQLMTQVATQVESPNDAIESGAREGGGENAAESGSVPPRSAIWQWIVRLHARYPDDPAILAPAVLNLVWLRSGEALFLSAGEAHAYLQGVGVEIMANSDNVLRGGLTKKHVDSAELLRLLRFQSRVSAPLRTRETRVGGVAALQYPCSAAEFQLERLLLGGGEAQSGSERSPVVGSGEWGVERPLDPAAATAELLFCAAGTTHVRHFSAGAAAGSGVQLRRGQALFVPAAAGAYGLGGNAELFRVTIPAATGVVEG